MNKQIEEMARIICAPTANKAKCEKCGFKMQCSKFDAATDIYNAGYRKTFTSEFSSDTQKAFKEGYEKAKTEVAREIFEEIEKLLTLLDKRHMQAGNPKQSWGIRNAMSEIAELKKKYEVTDK